MKNSIFCRPKAIIGVASGFFALVAGSGFALAETPQAPEPVPTAVSAQADADPASEDIEPAAEAAQPVPAQAIPPEYRRQPVPQPPVPQPNVEPPVPETPGAEAGVEEAAPDVEFKLNLKDAGDMVVIDAGLVQISIHALVQAQIALYTGENTLLQNGDPANSMGFRLRHARFGLSGWAFDSVDFEVSFDAAHPDGVQIVDAYMGYHRIPWLGVTVGAHKVPFSRFAMQGSGKGTLSERPLGVKALAPFRQIGLSIDGSIGDDLLRYQVGVYNGFHRGSGFHQGYVEGFGAEGNLFKRIAVAGRVEIAPLGGVGKEMADINKEESLRFSVGAAMLYNDDKAVTTVGWEADLLLKAYGFHLAFEYLSDFSSPSEDPSVPGTLPADLSRLAVVGELGYMILPGTLGLAVRVEYLDDDDRLEDQGDTVVVGGGIQYYWHHHHVKATLDYTHREELHGLALDDDTLLLQLQLEL